MLSRFIKNKYNNVEVAFVAHSTTAKEVGENEFFHKGQSGGKGKLNNLRMQD